jgi:hypothetical protein
LREALERGERVRNRKQFRPVRLGISGQAVRRHDTGQRACFQSRHDKIVSIVTRSVYRDE